MTYFLEKTFNIEVVDLEAADIANSNALEDHFKLVHAVIRPCQSKYSGIVKHFKHKSYKSCSYLILEGCIENYDAFFDGSLEQWLVTLATDKGIMPDFERHMIQHNGHCYIAKTIDLKTGKVLEDATDRILKKIHGETDVTYGISTVEIY